MGTSSCKSSFAPAHSAFPASVIGLERRKNVWCRHALSANLEDMVVSENNRMHADPILYKLGNSTWIIKKGKYSGAGMWLSVLFCSWL